MRLHTIVILLLASDICCGQQGDNLQTTCVEATFNMSSDVIPTDLHPTDDPNYTNVSRDVLRNQCRNLTISQCRSLCLIIVTATVGSPTVTIEYTIADTIQAEGATGMIITNSCWPKPQFAHYSSSITGSNTNTSRNAHDRAAWADNFTQPHVSMVHFWCQTENTVNVSVKQAYQRASAKFEELLQATTSVLQTADKTTSKLSTTTIQSTTDSKVTYESTTAVSSLPTVSESQTTSYMTTTTTGNKLAVTPTIQSKTSSQAMYEPTTALGSVPPSGENQTTSYLTNGNTLSTKIAIHNTTFSEATYDASTSTKLPLKTTIENTMSSQAKHFTSTSLHSSSKSHVQRNETTAASTKQKITSNNPSTQAASTSRASTPSSAVDTTTAAGSPRTSSHLWLYILLAGLITVALILCCLAALVCIRRLRAAKADAEDGSSDATEPSANSEAVSIDRGDPAGGVDSSAATTDPRPSGALARGVFARKSDETQSQTPTLSSGASESRSQSDPAIDRTDVLVTQKSEDEQRSNVGENIPNKSGMGTSAPAAFTPQAISVTPITE